MKWLNTAKNQNPQATELSQVKEELGRVMRDSHSATSELAAALLGINSGKPMN